jgi:hypothetical protein
MFDPRGAGLLSSPAGPHLLRHRAHWPVNLASANARHFYSRLPMSAESILGALIAITIVLAFLCLQETE